MISLAALAVFSGLSLNLLFSFALGATGAAKAAPKGESQPLPFFQLAVMFVSVLFLWALFSFAVPPFWTGFSVYFLLFPLSALACVGLEFSCARLFPKSAAALSSQKVFSAFTAYDGLVPASLLLTFILAGTFSGAIVLSLFFAIGNLTAMLVLNEIRRRSALERVPRFLRGSPLILISAGLLALVCASAAVIGFNILGMFP